MSKEGAPHLKSGRVAPYTTSEDSTKDGTENRTSEPSPNKQRIGQPSPYETANIVNRAAYWWMNRVFSKARKVGLVSGDIFKCPSWEGSKMLTESLYRYWKPYSQKEKPMFSNALLWCIIRANRYTFSLIILLSFTMVILRFIQPLLVSELLSYYQKEVVLSNQDLILYIGLLMVSNIIILVLYSANEFMKGLVAMRMRTACTGLTFRKIMRLSTQTIQKSSSGRIMNILSTDVERFVLLGRVFEVVLTAPVEILLCVSLVSLELDVAAVPFSLLTVSGIVLHCMLGARQGGLRREAAAHTDRRVSMMGEVLTAMRVIKMQCWEKPITARATLLRKLERTHLLRAATFMNLSMSLSCHTERIFVFTAAVCAVSLQIQLSPKSALRVIGWLKMIESTVLLSLPLFFNLIFDIAASVSRIQEFAMDDDVLDILEEVTESPCVIMKDAVISWDTDKQESFKLSGVTLEVRRSTLLLALLGELGLQSGQKCLQGRVAYVPQEAWVVSGTLRYNVTMGAPYVESRYRDAIHMASLQEDIQDMPHGDLTLIGELGLSLSGGQKARVNMARALYMDAQIYLFDDPLSAVDSRVGSHLFHSCIRNYLQKKICILVTHHTQYARYADRIMFLDKGHVVASGSFQEVSEKLDLTEYVKETIQNEPPTLTKSTSTDSEKLAMMANGEQKDAPVEEVLPEEVTGAGQVAADTLVHYLRAGRAALALPVCVLLLVTSRATGVFCDWWITQWGMLVNVRTDDTFQNTSLENNTMNHTAYAVGLTNDVFFAIYTGSLVVSLVTGMLFTVIACQMTSLASDRLYSDMFRVVLRAPMTFFEKQPVGRILNRFSRDMGFMDDMVPFSFIFLSNEVANIMAALVYTALISPWTLLGSGLFLPALVTIRQYMIAGARDVRRLEANKRSPTFSLLYSYLKGLPVIRAHRLQARMLSLAHDVIDGHTGAWHMLLACQRWLAVRSDLAAYLYLCLLLVLMPFVPIADSAWSSYGLALFYLIRLISTTSLSTREAADLEIHMMCVERVRQYAHLPQEAPAHTPLRPPEGWPLQGRLDIRDMAVSYQGGPRVLQGVSLTVNPAEKIGIVGRTGSGKTTLMMALLRIREPEGDIVVDGINIKDLGLADLRRNISVIPQDPILFSGSLRSNIDPFDEYSENQIQTALQQVELWESIGHFGQGLDTPVSEGGESLSVGQRQLLCLARALLKQSKLLIIDEATANVDHKTDLLIQKTLRDEFSECTVLNIAHRLHTIIDYDKILVLHAGRVVQCDHAYLLLQETDGLFYSMVAQTGAATFELLLERASESFVSGRGSNPRSSRPSSISDEQ